MPKTMIDCRYLVDMRQWVGETTFALLAAQAGDNLAAPLDELTAAWRRGEDAALRDAAHRLKGAASSIGCCALAQAAEALLDGRRRPGAVGAAEIEDLRSLLQASLQALAAFAAQPHVTPVPAKPQ